MALQFRCANCWEIARSERSRFIRST